MSVFSPIIFKGRGLHTGIDFTVKVTPFNDKQIIFVTPSGHVNVSPKNILPFDSHRGFSTVLKQNGVTVSTVEHLLCALSQFKYGAKIEIGHTNSKAADFKDKHFFEIPAIDGCAEIFYNSFLKAGWPAEIKFIDVLKGFTITFKDSVATVIPNLKSKKIKYKVELEYENIYMGKLQHEFYPGLDSFVKEIASARTFALEKDVSFLKQKGLALGGTLDNALVIGDNGILNKDGKRFDNEPARHKMLDLIGDLSLLGGLPAADIIVKRPGHAINAMIVMKIYKLSGKYI